MEEGAGGGMGVRDGARNLVNEGKDGKEGRRRTEKDGEGGGRVRR